MRDKYLTVTALTKYIKQKIDLDPHLKTVWLKGEISNFTHHRSGHMYFTLKDQTSRIQSVMFAGSNRALKFQPENGLHVLIKGEVSVFEPYGQYQLYVHQMEPDGLGALYLAFEQLKEKLKQKGYFLDEHKLPIPSFPRHIGLITSPTGAAVRDILTTLKRRYPIVKTTIIPAVVQGEQAAPSIQRALGRANDLGFFDVLILARGGGSIEDLWPFNEEIVAEAIYQSKIPIISAIGHETDVTIADYIADLRAPTPTGAAEIAVPSIKELKDRINQWQLRLTQTINYHIEVQEKSLTSLQQSYAFKYPDQLIKQKEQHLDMLTHQLGNMIIALTKSQKEQLNYYIRRLTSLNIPQLIQEKQSEIKQLTKRNHLMMNHIYQSKSERLNNILNQLSLVNPLSIMQRGYAVVYDKNDTIIKSISETEVSDDITVQIADGKLHCQVVRKEEATNDGE